MWWGEDKDLGYKGKKERVKGRRRGALSVSLKCRTQMFIYREILVNTYTCAYTFKCRL